MKKGEGVGKDVDGGPRARGEMGASLFECQFKRHRLSIEAGAVRPG